MRHKQNIEFNRNSIKVFKSRKYIFGVLLALSVGMASAVTYVHSGMCYGGSQLKYLLFGFSYEYIYDDKTFIVDTSNPKFTFKDGGNDILVPATYVEDLRATNTHRDFSSPPNFKVFVRLPVDLLLKKPENGTYLPSHAIKGLVIKIRVGYVLKKDHSKQLGNITYTDENDNQLYNIPIICRVTFKSAKLDQHDVFNSMMLGTKKSKKPGDSSAERVGGVEDASDAEAIDMNVR